MKIDEACINHNALRVINEIVGCPYEYAEQDESADHCRLMTLGAVRGVLDMAETMKEVLKGEEAVRRIDDDPSHPFADGVMMKE